VRERLEEMQKKSMILTKKLNTSKIFKRKVKNIVISMIVSLFTTELKQPEDPIMH
jgi:hypothetical protein